MAGEKTEQPTAKRLREAREKGEVAKSQEVPSAATVLAVTCWFLFAVESIYADLRALAGTALSMGWGYFEGALGELCALSVAVGLKIIAPLTAVIIVASLASSLAQVGVLFSVKAALPKIENLSSAKWFKKPFSRSNAVDLLKNIIKVTVLSVVVWKVLTDHWGELFGIPEGTAEDLARIIGSTMRDLFLYSAASFAALAALDYAYQRLKFTKDHMMTKDEVKREYKDMEGDPLIKSRRRQLHMEMASQSAVGRVKGAKVLITNPDHIAVALDYDAEKDPLPRVVARGEGELARRMIKEARENNVPIMRDVTLARDLYANSVADQYIPRDLVEAAAVVLRWAADLKSR